MSLDRAWIAAHIPHQGRMCLLEQVLSWDADRITCTSRTHLEPDHPLRAHGRLGAACALEYAAQAMAVHGALLQPQPARAGSFGLLASARALQLHDAHGALYAFTVSAAQGLLAQGRASLLLDAAAASMSAAGVQL